MTAYALLGFIMDAYKLEDYSDHRPWVAGYFQCRIAHIRFPVIIIANAVQNTRIRRISPQVRGLAQAARSMIKQPTHTNGPLTKSTVPVKIEITPKTKRPRDRIVI